MLLKEGLLAPTLDLTPARTGTEVKNPSTAVGWCSPSKLRSTAIKESATFEGAMFITRRRVGVFSCVSGAQCCLVKGGRGGLSVRQEEDPVLFHIQCARGFTEIYFLEGKKHVSIFYYSSVFPFC